MVKIEKILGYFASENHKYMTVHTRLTWSPSRAHWEFFYMKGTPKNVVLSLRKSYFTFLDSFIRDLKDLFFGRQYFF